MNNGFLEQVRAFVAIANTRSISAAAAFLGVAQPTISRQLASLEESLGRSLVQRSTRALTLTGDGESFLPHALQLIEAADQAIDALRPTAASFTGCLKVSCSHAFGKRILIPALPAWQRLHPELELELIISDGIEPIVPLGLDLAIRVGQLKSSNLIARKIGQFDRYVVASRGYLSTHDAIAEPADLKKHDCLMVSGFEKRPWILKKANESASVAVTGPLTLSTVDSLRDAVLAGLGIALTPAWFWPEEISTGSVMRLFEDYQTQGQSVYAVSAHRHASDSKEFGFIEFVREAFRPHNVD